MTAPCGTPAGHARHRRRHEPPCDPCWVAYRIADAAYKRAARARPAELPPCKACRRPRKPCSGARGWCRVCYGRWLAHGDPSVAPSRTVDEVAVERAVFGDRPERPLTTAERELVVKRLTRIGLSDPRIAEHLDIGPGGVFRIRKRLKFAAVPVERRIAVAA